MLFDVWHFVGSKSDLGGSKTILDPFRPPTTGRLNCSLVYPSRQIAMIASSPVTASSRTHPLFPYWRPMMAWTRSGTRSSRPNWRMSAEQVSRISAGYSERRWP